MTTRILFVCLGNICRSPSAEAVFRSLSEGLDVQIDSAGTGAYHVGEPPDGPMQQAAARRGYDMSDLRARQFTAADFDRFDLIIAMDADNLRDINRLRGASQTPVRLFTDYAGGAGDMVPDPYYTRDFDGTLDLIERCAQGLRGSL
ncbi:low molecular weight phosphotyrosine protein phosphatase [Primorskyibacter aestuariivivens]|uniref:low molecular weight protein-tyrosine-phosphatase n=1 Tax=Primorskyibacter aestuariivivens TaxID=1888912 RepID=UPI0023013880|nr:low molecular weight protein-tyrosine-phosphatase [Primorskyibacter aestuariivivens]MDA7427445.1 low molecular weight phosphotyrosine protein phosphatase [Primorskyibacter aestuariivivens]